ncbi:MAG: GNAT family N-acetyltransferase [Pedobacter sp.]|nr:MAG: GNAT family N-acetyltransferase [Pedobacter sp.]
MISIPLDADHRELLEVWESSVRATHFFLTEEHLLFYKKMIEDGYLNSLDLYCIRDHDRIVGFMGIEGTFLQMLFIREQYMGRGVGGTLLNYAINVREVVNLEVNEQNDQAVGFYEHFGFRAISRSDLDGAGNPYPILSMLLEVE